MTKIRRDMYGEEISREDDNLNQTPAFSKTDMEGVDEAFDPSQIEGPRQIHDMRMSSRVTVRSDVVHQTPDSEPRVVSVGYDIPLKDDEESYQRKMKVGPEWLQIDVGWAESYSLLCLKNVDVINLMVQPTESQRREIAEKIIEVGIGGSLEAQDIRTFMVLRPNAGCYFEPSDITRIFLRCPCGTSKCMVTVIPR